MTNPFDSIRQKTEMAHSYAGAIEEKLRAVVPALERLRPTMGRSVTKLDAVILTLEEVSNLTKDIKAELGAGESHLTEDTEILQEVLKDATEHRQDLARLDTITRHINFFLEDPQHLKSILWGVVKARPELKQVIQQWLDGPSPRGLLEEMERGE